MKRFRYPAILLAAALVGAALQVWCQMTAFDPVTRLVISAGPALLILKLWFWALPVLALLVSLPLRGQPAAGRGELYAHLGRGSRFLGALAGLVTAAGGLLQLTGNLGPVLRGTWSGLGACAVDVLLCAGGGCMVWLTAGAGRSRSQSLAALIPGFGACFWLVIFYHVQSRDPVVVRYVWTLLCLMASVLALYHQAAYCFGRPAPVRAQLLTLTAGGYAFSALPSAAEPAQALLLLGLGCWMLLQSLLIAAAPAPEPPEPTGASGDGGAPHAPEPKDSEAENFDLNSILWEHRQ